MKKINQSYNYNLVHNLQVSLSKEQIKSMNNTKSIAQKDTHVTQLYY
ncbi:hypothetical protein [Paraphotobacterium marinum]|nr:hypothetical protein [Paraphotobacterium marinum]